jgi:hypothetical protein
MDEEYVQEHFDFGGIVAPSPKQSESRRRCYGRTSPTGGSGCSSLRDFPEEIKAIIEQKMGRRPQLPILRIANMAILQSAPERRALTISVSVPLSSWPGNLPGPTQTSADLCCPESPALPVPAIPPTPQGGTLTWSRSEQRPC